MITRRELLRLGTQSGLAAASAPFLFSSLSEQAFAQLASSYRAVVLVEQFGGNDANNMVVPMNNIPYLQYNRIRQNLALNLTDLVPLMTPPGTAGYGLHWAMPSIASLFNSRQALIVANVGPLRQPVTKQQLINNPSLGPSTLFNHAVGRAQWESSSADSSPQFGWGGRVGDVISAQSGQLPPVLNASYDALFTVGRSVQGVAVQSDNGAFFPIPAGLNAAILQIAQQDCQSPNEIVAATAKLRVSSMQQQVVLQSAMDAGSPLRTQFSNSAFGHTMRTIAQVINGRSAVGCSRQIFFCQQGSYDSHKSQMHDQADNLRDLDTNVALFMQALAEMGLMDQVLVCTHSDFGRTLQPNTIGGSDHAWGNHHIVLGGGIRGGRILGSMPDLELGGPSDYNGGGVWIPTTAVTQMTAGIASWMGLSANQVASVFPDLTMFPNGALSLL